MSIDAPSKNATDKKKSSLFKFKKFLNFENNTHYAIFFAIKFFLRGLKLIHENSIII